MQSKRQKDLFACNGTGKRTAYKREKGNWKVFKAGTSFTVKDARYYGRTYGGKVYGTTPGRFHLTCTGRTDKREFIRAPLDACRLDRDELTDDELRERANKLSYSHNYVRAFNGTWIDSNGDYIGRYTRQRDKKTG